MANINNGSDLNFVLYTKTYEQFNSDLLTNETLKKPGTLVFLVQDKSLYLDGTYYGLSERDRTTIAGDFTSLSNLLSTETGRINGIISLIAEPIQVGGLREGTTEYNFSTIGPALNWLSDQVISLTNSGASTQALQDAIQAAQVQWETYADDLIAGLDATVYSTGSNLTEFNADTTSKVKAYIEQQDGVLTNFVIATNDIASAQALSNLTSVVNTLNGADNVEGSVAKQIKDAKEALIGDYPNNTSWGNNPTKTLTALRDLIAAQAAQIDTLSGVDTTTLAKIERLVHELQDASENDPDLANTLLDKFLTLYGTPTNGQFMVNGSAAYSDLQSIINAIETELAGVSGDASTQISTAITTANNYTDTQIGLLDSTQWGGDNADEETQGHTYANTTAKVAVQVVETDGKITDVNVKTNDIASASALSTLQSTVSQNSTDIQNIYNQMSWVVI